MKTIKIFACMFLLSIASTVNAQFTNSSASCNVASAPVDNKGWSGLNISYNSTEIDMDIDDINVMRAKRSSDANLASASFEYDGTKNYKGVVAALY